jgi:hypothetical protein
VKEELAVASPTVQPLGQAAPATGPGVLALQHALGAGSPLPSSVAGLIAQFPTERDPILATLHATLGNAFVQQVLAAPPDVIGEALTKRDAARAAQAGQPAPHVTPLPPGVAKDPQIAWLAQANARSQLLDDHTLARALGAMTPFEQWDVFEVYKTVDEGLRTPAEGKAFMQTLLAYNHPSVIGSSAVMPGTIRTENVLGWRRAIESSYLGDAGNWARSIPPDRVAYVQQLFNAGPNTSIALPGKAASGTPFARGLTGDYTQGHMAGIRESVELFVRGAGVGGKYAYDETSGDHGPSAASYAHPLMIRGRAEQVTGRGGDEIILPKDASWDNVTAIELETPTSHGGQQWGIAFLHLRDIMIHSGIALDAGSRGGRFATELDQLIGKYSAAPGPDADAAFGALFARYGGRPET